LSKRLVSEYGLAKNCLDGEVAELFYAVVMSFATRYWDFLGTGTVVDGVVLDELILSNLASDMEPDETCLLLFLSSSQCPLKKSAYCERMREKLILGIPPALCKDGRLQVPEFLEWKRKH
jgi:hypothetical protein